jgi:V8-like Glu-specific endopeptidase
VHTRIINMSLAFLVAVVLVGLLPADALAQGREVQRGAVTSFTPSRADQVWTASDYANAKPMPMPSPSQPALWPDEGGVELDREGTPGFEPGFAGNGKMTPVRVPRSTYVDDGFDVEPQEYGTSRHVFTTVRVDVTTGIPTRYYPFRAAGKLYFKIGSGNYVCSASLIKRGVIVTAAHCVTAFGGAWYTSWRFVPAYYGAAPYGNWYASNVAVMTSYKNGTDSCKAGARGVVCRNDIAVIRLTAQSGRYPGTSTGWFGYGWDGYGFNTSNLALINQLGYPVSHDGGNKMQRTDSEGFTSGSMVSNTVWGGRQTGGSSGGPELVNLGIYPVLSGGIGFGSEANANIVVGVTSWGYTNQGIKQQGASRFVASNIPALVSVICSGFTGRGSACG